MRTSEDKKSSDSIDTPASWTGKINHVEDSKSFSLATFKHKLTHRNKIKPYLKGLSSYIHAGENREDVAV